MNKKINIEVNGSIIGLNLNEFWYFHYYLKNIASFYNKSENHSKKIMISFPGTALRLIADRSNINNISRQVKSYIEFYNDEINILNNN